MCRQFDPAPRHHIFKHPTLIGCFLWLTKLTIKSKSSLPTYLQPQINKLGILKQIGCILNLSTITQLPSPNTKKSKPHKKPCHMSRVFIIKALGVFFCASDTQFFFDTSRLTRTLTQVVKFGTTDITTTFHLNTTDDW